MSRTLYRVEAGDPYQCQANDATGQCCYMSLKGLVHFGHLEDPNYTYREVNNCPRHNGFAAAKHIEAKRVEMYRTAKWQQRITEFSESENVKTLRQEIGILRLLIEETLNQCTDSTQLMIYSSRIGKLVTDCEKLVRSCDRLEDRMGIMMDKAAALAFASKIVEVIAAHVTDPDAIDAISDEIIKTLGEVTSGNV